jgi:hypothetical protein
MTPLLQTVCDWAKRTYPVNGRIYRVTMRRELWRQLATDLFMSEPYRYVKPMDAPFAVVIRNVHFQPRIS